MKNNPTIDDIFNTNLYFNWSNGRFGFGQLSVWKDDKGKLLCSNECLSRDSVRELLVAFANEVADKVTLLEEPFGTPPSID